MTEINDNFNSSEKPLPKLDRTEEKPKRFRMVAVNSDENNVNKENSKNSSDSVLISHYDRGISYQKEGQYQAAISEYKLALARDENYSLATVKIALIEYEEGEIDRAILKWDEIVKENPDLPEAKLALATAFYNKGRKFEAFRMAKSAITLDERFGDREYLQENLWGDRLIADAEIVLSKLR